MDKTLLLSFIVIAFSCLVIFLKRLRSLRKLAAAILLISCVFAFFRFFIFYDAAVADELHPCSEGIYIKWVDGLSPAERAGMSVTGKPLERIIEINNQNVSSLKGYRELLDLFSDSWAMIVRTDRATYTIQLDRERRGYTGLVLTDTEC